MVRGAPSCWALCLRTDVCPASCTVWDLLLAAGLLHRVKDYGKEGVFGQFGIGMWHIHAIRIGMIQEESRGLSKKGPSGSLCLTWLGHVYSVARVGWACVSHKPRLYLSWEVIYTCKDSKFNFKWLLLDFYWSHNAFWKEKCVITCQRSFAVASIIQVFSLKRTQGTAFAAFLTDERMLQPLRLIQSGTSLL